MKITLLGTGTSTGVPVPCCPCEVCNSANPKNKRLRCSALVETKNGNILIDTSTDLRYQALRYSISSINAVIYTHSHADHTHGLDDLRSFNFIQKSRIPLYAEKETAEDLNRRFPYAFNKNLNYEGGAPAKLDLNVISSEDDFTVLETKITPLPVLHGKSKVLGFRLGDFAYLTDCSEIPKKTMEKLAGLDTLVLDALRKRPHKTHFTVEQAIEKISEIKPKSAYLTHISHELEHEQTNEELKNNSKIPIALGFDGLVINL